MVTGTADETEDRAMLLYDVFWVRPDGVLVSSFDRCTATVSLDDDNYTRAECVNGERTTEYYAPRKLGGHEVAYDSLPWIAAERRREATEKKRREAQEYAARLIAARKIVVSRGFRAHGVEVAIDCDTKADDLLADKTEVCVRLPGQPERRCRIGDLRLAAAQWSDADDSEPAKMIYGAIAARLP